VKKLLIPLLFNFGHYSGVLRDVKEGEKLARLSSISAKWRTGLETLGFPISVRVFDKTIKSELETLQTAKVVTLSAQQAETFREKINFVLMTANAEVEDVHVFTFAVKRYSYTKLNENVDQLFRVDVFGSLPEIAQFDFSEACKCILVERATAAAFHCLRGVEAVLRAFHDKKVATPAGATATWGSMEANLKHASPALDEAILGQLTLVRTRFRNQTQHPKLRYDIDEAQDLLNICIELTNRMSYEI
jgi:hypothetical protein